MTATRWTNGILAIWLAISAFLGFSVVGNVVNLVTVGVVVAGVGIALLQESRWQGWTATAAGLSLVVAAFVPGLQTGAGLVWDSLIVAAAILVASLPVKAHTPTHVTHDVSTAAPAATRPAPEAGHTPKQAREPEVGVEGERELVHH